MIPMSINHDIMRRYPSKMREPLDFETRLNLFVI